MDGGELPTRDEWIKEQEIKNGINKPMSKFGSDTRGQIIQGRK
jgi:hypothetical protein